MRDLVILLIDETGLAVAIPIVPIGSWLGQTPSRLEVSSDTCPGGHGPNPCNGPLLPPPVSRSILKCTTRSDLLPPLTPPSPSSTPDELLHLRDPLVMCL